MQPKQDQARCSLFYLLPLFLAEVLGCQSLPNVDAPKLFDHESRQDQLVLHSDFAVPASEQVLAELCEHRDYLASELSLPQTTVPIHIYLFATEDRYYDFLDRRFPGFPRRRAIFVETAAELAVYAHWGNRVAEDLRHEVTHGYLHAAVSNLPLWLDEGLAEYFEVGSAKQGRNQAHVDHLRSLKNFEPNLSRLEQLDSAAEMTQLDYAESWAWVHWLLSSSEESKQLLSTHLGDLQQGNTARLDTKLYSQFPDPPSTLVSHLQKLR